MIFIDDIRHVNGMTLMTIRHESDVKALGFRHSSQASVSTDNHEISRRYQAGFTISTVSGKVICVFDIS